MNAARTPHQPGPPRPRGGLRSRSEAWFASLTDSRDRQRAALGRQRRIVGAAKVILPALAAILLVAIVIFPGLRSGARFGRVTYREMPGSNAAALSRLTGAQYRGIDARGEKFTITASHAVQSGGDQLDLDRPKGDITTRSGSWFMLDASNGVYHQKS
ncbi:MAG: LPS export ABC transporter periplasmic protein LptC, partial [Acidiphilium sp. 37-67-22]